MEQFITILHAILKRPGMFKINNIEDLYLFTQGYSFACSDKGDTSIHLFLNDFSIFILTKYDHQEQQVDWSRYIRYISGGDIHSLELFENNFIEYCNKNHIAWPE